LLKQQNAQPAVGEMVCRIRQSLGVLSAVAIFPVRNSHFVDQPA
jgi:hypothetical protein